jgi:polyribonucleotide nucleotidyltransferase
MTFSIPAHKCGLVIGRGGENIKAINQQTGAFVEISRQLPPNGDLNFKLFVIRGSPQQIDHAKQLIEDKIEVCRVPAQGKEERAEGWMDEFVVLGNSFGEMDMIASTHNQWSQTGN